MSLLGRPFSTKQFRDIGLFPMGALPLEEPYDQCLQIEVGGGAEKSLLTSPGTEAIPTLSTHISLERIIVPNLQQHHWKLS